MRATVFAAPKLVAIVQAVIFRDSNGVTATNKSARFTPAFFRTSNEVGEPTTVIKL